MSPAELTAIRSALLRYYDAHARDLPWRRTRDPYAIWVSEVMLQQTRVETVVAYYERFLKRFPDARALARASEDEVLASWSGLGYYRRARLLHAGVRDVVARYGGLVPREPEARKSLPGVGRYTAGAIGSIAFDLAEPLVDGNVARVFARLFAIDTPPERADTQARLWALAESLVHGERPGALNQAVMELGARVCRRVAPLCETCPVAAHCRARASGRVAELPAARKRAEPRPVALVGLAAFDRSGERLLLVRGAGTLFGGLWNLPMCEGRGPAAAARLWAELELGAGDVSAKPAARIEHVLSHRRLALQLFSAEIAGEVSAPGLRLQPRAALDELGVSRFTRKALEALPERPGGRVRASAALLPRAEDRARSRPARKVARPARTR